MLKKRLFSLLFVLVFAITSLWPMLNVEAGVSKDGNTYTVEKGDSLYRIGKELGRDWRELAKLNGIKEPWKISIGQVLKLTADETKKEQKPDKEEKKPTKAPEKTEQPKQEIDEPKQETDESKQIERSETAFDEIVYERPDFEKIQEGIQNIENLITKKADVETVFTAYNEVGDALILAATAATYTMIKSYLDVTDTYYAAEYAYVTQACSVLQNQFIELTDRILASYPAKEIEAHFSEEDAEALKRAKMLGNENTIELNVQEQELVNAYMNAVATVTFDVAGTKMTLNEMLSQPGLTYEEQMKYYYEYIDALNAVAGDIYLQLIEVRNQIADELNFDSYLYYGYFNYDRDYKPSQSAKLHKYVKEHIVPAYLELSASLTEEDIMQLNSAGGDIAAFDPIYRMFFDEVSPELQEVYDYMLQYKLYDFNSSPVKTNLSYTTLLSAYHQPYMNIYPTGMFLDISTFVHEFGHYHAYYKHDTELKTILDIMEVHSQGLEVLFAPYFAAYGDAASSIVKYNFINYLSILINGCLEDEFQQYVYSNDIKSVKQLNEIYYELQLEYGLAAESDVKEITSWVLITHTFNMPLYYISYAASLVPALEIFDMSTTDREAAIEVYNSFVEEGTKNTFLNTLKASGLESPFQEKTISSIAESIYEYFGLQGTHDADKAKELDPAA